MELKKGKSFHSRFVGGKYMCRICPVYEIDLDKTIKDEKLKYFLESKLKE